MEALVPGLREAVGDAGAADSGGGNGKKGKGDKDGAAAVETPLVQPIVQVGRWQAPLQGNGELNPSQAAHQGEGGPSTPAASSPPGERDGGAISVCGTDALRVQHPCPRAGLALPGIIEMPASASRDKAPLRGAASPTATTAAGGEEEKKGDEKGDKGAKGKRDKGAKGDADAEPEERLFFVIHLSEANKTQWIVRQGAINQAGRAPLPLLLPRMPCC